MRNKKLYNLSAVFSERGNAYAFFTVSGCVPRGTARKGFRRIFFSTGAHGLLLFDNDKKVASP